jgi:hypothetical protein
VKPFVRAAVVVAATFMCLAPVAAGIQLAASAVAHTVAGPSTTGEGDPGSSVWHFLDARNRGDLDASLALVADDLIYIDGWTCAEASPCVGREVVRRQLAYDIAEGTVTSLLGVPRVSGARVQLTALIWAAALEWIGVDRILATITAEARDGKLTLYRSDPDQSDAKTVWWLRHRPPSGARRAARGPADSDLYHPNP